MIYLRNIYKDICQCYYDIRGWHTKQKFVVFESDDWGSIRMPSSQVLKELDIMGFESSKNKYEANDSLESNQDLIQLFDVLKKYKDGHGNSPIFTLNYIMANPDFEKIKDGQYQEYFYETISKTYERYNGSDSVSDICRQGLDENVADIQFHGREHFNVGLWMEALRDNIYRMRKIAEMGAVATNIPSKGGNVFVKAYDIRNAKELNFVKESITDGLRLFKERFGYRSITAIAPNYLWDEELEPVFFENGVRMLQGGVYHNYSTYNNKKRERNYLGQNRNGILFSVRNSTFEPYIDGEKSIPRCLNEIKKAFAHDKPAIITSHRVNYVGRLNENYVINLSYLSSLISEIIKEYPDVQFVSSSDIYKIIKDSLD